MSRIPSSLENEKLPRAMKLGQSGPTTLRSRKRISFRQLTIMPQTTLSRASRIDSNKATDWYIKNILDVFLCSLRGDEFSEELNAETYDDDLNKDELRAQLENLHHYKTDSINTASVVYIRQSFKSFVVAKCMCKKRKRTRQIRQRWQTALCKVMRRVLRNFAHLYS